MKSQITVYFDTSFYVQMCRLDKAQADELLHKLNMLNVRHVISDAILLELLSSADRSEKDAMLYERVNRFVLPPLKIGSFAVWDALLIDGDERTHLANMLIAVFMWMRPGSRNDETNPGCLVL